MAWAPSTIIAFLVIASPATMGVSPTPNRDGSPRECRDCRPVPARITRQGEPLVYWRGAWWDAVALRWHVGPGPNQLWYVCARELDLEPRCVFSGQGLYQETTSGRSEPSR